MLVIFNTECGDTYFLQEIILVVTLGPCHWFHIFGVLSLLLEPWRIDILDLRGWWLTFVTPRSLPLDAKVLCAFLVCTKVLPKYPPLGAFEKWVLFPANKSKVRWTEPYLWHHIQKLWILNVRESCGFLREGCLLLTVKEFPLQKCQLNFPEPITWPERAVISHWIFLLLPRCSQKIVTSSQA